MLAVLACGRPSAPRVTIPPDTMPLPAPAPFVDEFSGTEVDREKWLVYTGPVYNSELQQYVDDGAHVRIVHGAEAEGAENGALLIRASHRRDGSRPEFVSGRLHGRVPLQYGTVTARIKLPTGAGMWPAFWLLGGGDWPATGEIDIMENVGDSSWVNAALHGPGYSGNTPFVRRLHFPPEVDATDWHEYETTWTRDSIVFRVDRVPYYRVMRSDVWTYGPPEALDSPKFVILNLAIGGTYPSAVNGVRSPRLGLPDRTVERIDGGEARMLVDWVRTRR